MPRILVALALAAFAAPAAAQPAPWQPERTTAGWVFTPSIVLGGLWDSNATVRNENDPITSETVGLVSPRAEIGFNGKRSRLGAGYSGVLEAYRNLEELTRYDQRGRLDARYQSTARLLFHTRHAVTLTPTTDQLELAGVPFTRIGSRLLDSLGGFAYDLSPRAKLSGNYTFQWVQFDRSPRTASDFALLQGGHAHSPSAELLYALSPRVSVGGLWTYRHASIDGGEQIVDTQQGESVVQWAAGPNTTIRGSGGVAHLKISDSEENKTGPTFGAGVTHRAGQVQFGASYERAFVPSFGFGGASANQILRASVTAPFARGRVVANGSVTYRRSDPILSQGLTILLDSYWTQASLGYYVTRWLRMEGFYAFTHQSSSAQGLVDRTRIGVQFVTYKPVRIQ
jgi:hypothetical protein